MAVIVKGNGEVRILEKNETLTTDAKTQQKVLVVSPRVVPLPDWKNELAEFRKQLEKK